MKVTLYVPDDKLKRVKHLQRLLRSRGKSLSKWMVGEIEKVIEEKNKRAVELRTRLPCCQP